MVAHWHRTWAWGTKEFFAAKEPDDVASFLDEGADPNLAAPQPETPLHAAAAAARSSRTIGVLLRAGADLRRVEPHYGWGAMHFAATNHKNARVGRALMEAGADIHSPSTVGGHTPLVLAAIYCNADLAQELLKARVDPNAMDREGRTALHYACMDRDFESSVTIGPLIEAGADVNAADEDGFTPLIYASRCMADSWVLQALLDAGADPNAKDETWGRTALIEAAALIDRKGVHTLLEGGAEPDARDNTGATALHFVVALTYAATRPSVVDEHISDLLAAGADPDIPDNEGSTALHVAMRRRAHLETVVKLLEAGADPNRPGPDGRTAFDMAREIRDEHRDASYEDTMREAMAARREESAGPGL